MTRILLIGTASPKRVCEKLEQILRNREYPDPEISILCIEKDGSAFQSYPGVRVFASSEASKNRILRELRGIQFDLCFAFWTGEKRYRELKSLPVRLRARETYIAAGDRNEFRLTWKAICRHAFFRLRHPLPTDHAQYAAPGKERQKVLVIQSAEPEYVLRGLDRLKEKPFVNPSFTVFCRNRPEARRSFERHPMVQQVLTHSETRGSWSHLRDLRRQRFDAIVLFLTGDPGYWKVKIFAFLLGSRHILIFNEANDCFLFNVHQWLALLALRMQGPSGKIGTVWSDSVRILVSLALKSAIIPFRFIWLLLVWARLRSAGLKASRESHDYPL